MKGEIEKKKEKKIPNSSRNCFLEKPWVTIKRKRGGEKRGELGLGDEKSAGGFVLERGEKNFRMSWNGRGDNKEATEWLSETFLENRENRDKNNKKKWGGCTDGPPEHDSKNKMSCTGKKKEKSLGEAVPCAGVAKKKEIWERGRLGGWDNNQQ